MIASFSPCSTHARILAKGSLLSKDFLSGPLGAALPGALVSSSYPYSLINSAEPGSQPKSVVLDTKAFLAG